MARYYDVDDILDEIKKKKSAPGSLAAPSWREEELSYSRYDQNETYNEEYREYEEEQPRRRPLYSRSAPEEYREERTFIVRTRYKTCR